MRTELTLCAAIIGAGIPLFAQSATLGMKGRVPVDEALERVEANSAMTTKTSDKSPASKLHLPKRFSFQFDTMYRRLTYRTDDWRGGDSIYARMAANSWEIPVMLKMALSTGRMRPFVAGGTTLRFLNGIDPIKTSGRVAALNTRTDFTDRTDMGAVMSTGLDINAGPVHIKPEVRYTRWGSQNLINPVNAFLRSERDQGDFLLSITF